MTTVNDIIIDALEITGLKSPHDDLEAVWATVGLRRVNSILDGWNLDKSRSYTIQSVSTDITDLKRTYTIGDDEDIDFPMRPIAIEKAVVTLLDGSRYNLSILNYSDFKDAENLISSPSNPVYIWLDQKHPIGIVNIFPTPTASFNLEIVAIANFAPFASVSTTLSVPQGYERLLTYQLAIELCSHAGKTVPLDVRHTYSAIKRDVEAVNISSWVSDLKIISNSIPLHNVHADNRLMGGI